MNKDTQVNRLQQMIAFLMEEKGEVVPDYSGKSEKELEEISSRIIAIFEEKSMSYASAYNMLDLVHKVLEEKSTRVKL